MQFSPALKSYHLLPSVRGDLLAKLGRFNEAGEEFKRAVLLTHNVRERELLLEHALIMMKGKTEYSAGIIKGDRSAVKSVNFPLTK